MSSTGTVVAAVLSAWAFPAWGAPLDADACVEVAVRGSARVGEAAAKVAGYEARLAQVEAVYYPKLSGRAFVAPMFTVRGSALDADVERAWGLSDWGPYTRLEALLAQPLYTFGRAEAGAEAARRRAAVERARLEEARGAVALEVRRLYYVRLYALGMIQSLDAAAKVLAEAEARGQEQYAAGSGEVTQADLMRLRYGTTQVERFRRTAANGAALALSALEQAMGLAETAGLELAHDRLPPVPAEEPDSDLERLLAEAAQSRPEWAQIRDGRKAAEALGEAERKANLPVVFAAGTLEASWTPTRDDTSNPYHLDPYNDLAGGVAVGLQFDLDPALASARSDEAAALGGQVEAAARLAATGIPLQVRKAHSELLRHREQAALAERGVQATRRWMSFSAAAYLTGTGEARDLLEGVVAHLQAKQAKYESIRDYYLAGAELAAAVGRVTWKR